MQIAKVSSRQFFSLLVKYLDTQNLVWLAGAGLSMAPPCSLPSGPDIKNLAMASICGSPELGQYWKVIRLSSKYTNIIPEVIFQRLYECLGTKLFPFFDILRVAVSNSNHKALASISTLKRSPILTTNFDLLIDQYVAPGDSIVHLHGDIAHVEQMTITINRVGKGLQTDIARTIKRLVNARALCIVGYSGNDNDVRRAIVSCGAHSILWLVRDWSDPVIKNLNFLKQYPGTVFVTKWDLQSFFGALSRRYRMPRVSYRGSLSWAKRQSGVIHDWCQSLSRADRYACVSKLFIDLEEYELSVETAEKGFLVAETSRAGWFKNQSAFAMRMVGDFRKFTKLANEAVRYNRAASDRLGLAMAYNLLGLSKLEKSRTEPKKATPVFRKAIAILQIKKVGLASTRTESVQILLSQLFNNLGLSLRHEGKEGPALVAYKRSVRLKRITGDLIGYSQTCINISLLYYRRRKFKLAYSWRRRALDLIRKYDLLFQEAYLMREMGSAACEQGRLKVGHKLLTAALQTYEQIETSSFGITLTRRILKHFHA